MSDLDLEAIRARAAAARPGPWKLYGDGDPDDWRGITNGNDADELCIYDEGGHGHDDAVFIAHARQDVPALIAEVERLSRQVARADAAEGARAHRRGHRRKLVRMPLLRHGSTDRQGCAVGSEPCEPRSPAPY